MSMHRREFLQVLAAAAAAGLPLAARDALAATPASERMYDLPRFGNVRLLHFTDCHAQLLPIHFREPSVNLGVGAARGQAAASRRRSAAEALRHRARHARRARVHLPRLRRTPRARYGKVGGFAHLATLVKRLKATRPGALLLDGGDTWQGSATALWTQGQDMVDASKLLGVDVMTGALGVHLRRRARARRSSTRTSRAGSTSSRRT